MIEFIKRIVRITYNERDRTLGAGITHYVESAHGWIQWKGTSVCMDIHCNCGETHHIDTEFAYTIVTPCGRLYGVCAEIPLVEISSPTQQELEHAKKAF